jgi:hypothetical protein
MKAGARSTLLVEGTRHGDIKQCNRQDLIADYPGHIMSAVACVAEKHAVPMRTFSNKYMSPNLCRCGAYPHIVAAAAIANAVFNATGTRDRDLPITMEKLMPIFGISLRVTWRSDAKWK